MLLPGQSELVAVEQHRVPSPALSVVLCPSSIRPGCADAGQMCYWTTAGDLLPPIPASPVPPVFAVSLLAVLEVHQLLNCIYDLE